MTSGEHTTNTVGPGEVLTINVGSDPLRRIEIQISGSGGVVVKLAEGIKLMVDNEVLLLDWERAIPRWQSRVSHSRSSRKSAPIALTLQRQEHAT